MSVQKNPVAPLKDLRQVVQMQDGTGVKEEVKFDNGEFQWFVDQARQSYDASVEYFEATQLEQIERNLDNFASRHPADSRYHTEEYRYRSRTFKPKTRIAARQLEEDAAEIFFASQDLIDIRPVNKDSKEDAFVARVHKHMLMTHLEDNLEYFQFVMGGVQDAFKQGDVVSAVAWESDEGEGTNRPTWRLIPIENIHVDPAASWMDPVGTSPYVIEDMPMHIQSVQDRMAEPGEKPEGNQWRWSDVGVLLGASKRAELREGLRAKREGDTIDPLTSNTFRDVEEHMVVMVRRVILRVEGVDWLYYMVGGDLLLSDPVPLRDKAPWLRDGERDYQWGYAGVETHRVYKSAPAEWLQDLQAAANIGHNQRTDNITLALNKRYKVKRGRVLDLNSLRTSVPGGIYEVDEMDDVEPEQWADVGGASFYNEDRLTNDFDSLAGSFNQGSVASQRSLNETVGGMRMMAQGSGKARGYMVLTIAATWWGKVCDALFRMIKQYATEDEIIDAVDQMLADGEPVPDMQPLDLIKVPTKLKVNMRLGADPMTRMNNLMSVVANFRQTPIEMQVDWAELFKEGAAAAGFGDGDRFLVDTEGQDPQVAMLQQQIQEMQQIIEQKQVEQQGKMQIAQLSAETKRMSDQLKSQTALAIQEIKASIADQDRLIEAEQNEIDREELVLAREGLIHQLNVARFNMKKELRGLSEGDSESPAPGKAGEMARDDYGNLPGRTG